jgi:purine-binding chemotaxis protein CheW
VRIRDRAPAELPAEVAEVLRVRAERLRAAEAGDDEGTELWVAEFPVGQERFALPLESLRAVLPVSTVTAVPLSPPHVVGVLRFDGRITAVLSLASLLRSPGWRQDPTVVVVVDPGWGRLAALDCEAIPRALPVSSAIVEAARAAHPDRPVAEIVMPGERQRLNLIDLRRLLELRREERHGA